MMYKIFCQRGMREMLANRYHVTRGTVSNALNFRRNSDIALEIRNYAVNHLSSFVLVQ